MTHQEKRAWIMLVVSAAAYAVYCLCFFLSAILGSVTKVIAYRKGLPQW